MPGGDRAVAGACYGLALTLGLAALPAAAQEPAAPTPQADTPAPTPDAAPRGRPVESTFTPPRVIQQPTPAQVSALYPPAALRHELDGQARVTCKIQLDGHLGGCVIKSENPVGQGFGKAGVAVASYFLIDPPKRDGVPVAGGSFDIPVRFTIAQTPPPEAPAAALSPLPASTALADQPLASAPAIAPPPSPPLGRSPLVLPWLGLFALLVLGGMAAALYWPEPRRRTS
jgi:TonB family protein